MPAPTQTTMHQHLSPPPPPVRFTAAALCSLVGKPPFWSESPSMLAFLIIFRPVGVKQGLGWVEHGRARDGTPLPVPLRSPSLNLLSPALFALLPGRRPGAGSS